MSQNGLPGTPPELAETLRRPQGDTGSLMASPQLSRRLAKALPVMMALGLSLEERFALVERVERAQDFMDLNEGDRREIMEAERILASGVSPADLIS